ncbi:hypothetical protein ACSAGD_10640 [Paramicrobacterium sp. CJ85]|uniref:hypothetical protein n=1 Tax=Paramicrobacterium sp. CJ85 TaxID=3445355 RepID=UPI003F6004E6
MIVCITNDMDNVRPCTVKDQHHENCDGWETRLTDGKYIYTGKECTGCLPRRARHGVLCRPCFEKLEDALGKIPHWLRAMRGVERAVQRDNAGVRSKAGPPIPISPTQLAVDEVWSWYRHIPENVPVWISTGEGGRLAVRFTLAALAAMRSHPEKEHPHPVRRTRCPECGRLQLQWNPPGYFGDRVTVTCQYDDCDAELEQGAFEKVAEIEERHR